MGAVADSTPKRAPKRASEHCTGASAVTSHRIGPIYNQIELPNHSCAKASQGGESAVGEILAGFANKSAQGTFLSQNALWKLMKRKLLTKHEQRSATPNAYT
jgi:hypothetical protein